MKYFVCFFLSFPLFSREDNADTLKDFTRNRLFTMSTGYTQPKGTISVSILEFAGYQLLYTPFGGIQLNTGIVLPKNIIYGVKFQAYDGEGFVKALSMTLDASYYLNSEKTFKEHTKIYPSINATFGFDIVQFSTSFVSYTVEKFKYVPRDPFDWNYESDGFVSEREFVAVPALMQAGLSLHARPHRIKFITECMYEYEGKRNAYPLKAVLFGFKKYWNSSYFDFAFIIYYRHRTSVHTDTFVLPWIGWSGILP